MTRLLNRRLILLALGVITPILLTSLACNDSAEGELNSGASGQPAETKEDYWRNLTVEDVATKLDQGEHIDLHSAVANSRDPAIIALLLDRGADIEAEYRHPLSGGSPLSTDGRTALHLAAQFNGEPAVVELLLDRGADIEARDRRGQTALHLAAEFNGEPAVIALLLDRGADINAGPDQDLIDTNGKGDMPLHRAATRTDDLAVAVIELLLDRGAAINGRNYAKWVPLHRAISYIESPKAYKPQSHNVIEMLLGRGADVQARTYRGRTPLHMAVRVGDISLIGLLLDLRAEIEAKDENGWTPLHWAAHEEEPAVLALLLDRGADIHARDRGRNTLLHVAAQSNDNAGATALLLNRGADIGAVDGGGDTILHAAAITDEPEVVRLLLARGADPSVRNHRFRRQTPCDYLHSQRASHSYPSELEGLLCR